MKKIIRYIRFKNERGVSLVLVALLLIPLLGIGALVIDLGMLYAARNELQNAADAGALAGARNLYLSDGSAVNPEANQKAIDAATANFSHGSKVEVNINDVERGHWSFGLANPGKRGFTPNTSTSFINISNYTTTELDEMDGTDGKPAFINAVRVYAKRESTPVSSFFSRIFDLMGSSYSDGFKLKAEAIAYIGFAGNLEPYEIDYPLAICEDSITKVINGEEVLNVTTGRILASIKTTRWTDLKNCDIGNGDAAEIKALVKDKDGNCGPGNPNPIYFNQGLATNKGTVNSALDPLWECWISSDLEERQTLTDKNGKNPINFPAEPWPIRLPVVNCLDATPTCAELKGVLLANVLWVVGNNTADYFPEKMKWPGVQTDKDWDKTGTGMSKADLWESFITHFNLLDENGNLPKAEDLKKPEDFGPDTFTVYMHTDSKYIDLTGVTGGTNFGVMAKIPVLVN